MLKFRLWCFINKIKIFKANEKYKKIQKSGKKINIIMLGDSIPKGEICNERKKKIAVDKKLVKDIINKGICSKCGGTLLYRVVEMGECGKL